MERRRVSEDDAFAMLIQASQQNNRKVVAMAAMVATTPVRTDAPPIPANIDTPRRLRQRSLGPLVVVRDATIRP